MTQPNQSELEQLLNNLSKLNKLSGRGHGDLTDTCYICGISPSKLLAYITANYTPNAKLKALIEASEKLNLEFHGRPDCKNCELQVQLVELMKGRI